MKNTQRPFEKRKNQDNFVETRESAGMVPVFVPLCPRVRYGWYRPIGFMSAGDHAAEQGKGKPPPLDAW